MFWHSHLPFPARLRALRRTACCAAAGLLLCACEPQPSAPSAPPPAPSAPASPPPPAPTSPAPSGAPQLDREALARTLQAEWARLKADPEADLPGGGLAGGLEEGGGSTCPSCGAALVDLPLQASGGYSEVALHAWCCLSERTFWVRRTGGAMEGTVSELRGPFALPE